MTVPNTPKGRVIAVTGGAAGIGREIARMLASAGASVVIGDRDLPAAQRTAAELPGDVTALALDVTDTASFDAFLAEIRQHRRRLDVLVNNAGVMWVGPFADEPESATRSQLEVNLHGVIRGVRLAAPAMREHGGGHIVTVASAASKLPPAGEATYAATKHGVYGYLSAVRSELHGSGVRLSVVMPGVVDTELASGTDSGPLRRLAPTDVAAAVLRAVRCPRFEISVPRRLGIVTRILAVLPDRARALLLRAVVPNQLAADIDPHTRRDYESRAVTHTTGSPQ